MALSLYPEMSCVAFFICFFLKVSISISNAFCGLLWIKYGPWDWQIIALYFYLHFIQPHSIFRLRFIVLGVCSQVILNFFLSAEWGLIFMPVSEEKGCFMSLNRKEQLCKYTGKGGPWHLLLWPEWYGFLDEWQALCERSACFGPQGTVEQQQLRIVGCWKRLAVTF